MKMRFAIVEGQRREPEPGLLGTCQACEQRTVARCGKIRIEHWAHLGKLTCDPWWEMSEWHIAWQDKFPKDWQEFLHVAENGERHIADVKTDKGWVLEFQHSPIKLEERQAREAFYGKLVWIVDGKRRLKDHSQFSNALKERISTNPQLPVPVWRVSAEGCALLRDWAGNNTPVFFDFGDESIWCLIPKGSDGNMWATVFSRTDFINLYLGVASQTADGISDFLKSLTGLMSDLFFAPSDDPSGDSTRSATSVSSPKPTPGFSAMAKVAISKTSLGKHNALISGGASTRQQVKFVIVTP